MDQLVINANDIINMVEDIKVHDLKMVVDCRSELQSNNIQEGSLVEMAKIQPSHFESWATWSFHMYGCFGVYFNRPALFMIAASWFSVYCHKKCVMLVGQTLEKLRQIMENWLVKILK